MGVQLEQALLCRALDAPARSLKQKAESHLANSFSDESCEGRGAGCPLFVLSGDHGKYLNCWENRVGGKQEEKAKKSESESERERARER